MPSITLKVRRTDLVQLTAAATALAAEHGLAAELIDEGRVVAVRLSRAIVALDAAPPTPVLARLRRLARTDTTGVGTNGR